MTSPLPPLRLPDLPEQPGAFPNRNLEVTQADRDLFADLCDGGIASEGLATLDAEGIRAALKMANAVWWAVNSGGAKGHD